MAVNSISQQLKIKTLAFSVLFVALVIIYSFEFHWISNTINVHYLFIAFGLAGIVLGFWLSRKFTKDLKDRLEKIQISLLFIFLITAFSPLFGSLTNRLLSPNTIELQDFTFFEEKPKGDFYVINKEPQKPEAYFIFAIKDGKMHRIKTGTKRFEHTIRGDKIQLPVKKGLWGLEIICLN